MVRILGTRILLKISMIILGTWKDNNNRGKNLGFLNVGNNLGNILRYGNIGYYFGWNIEFANLRNSLGKNLGTGILVIILVRILKRETLVQCC